MESDRKERFHRGLQHTVASLREQISQLPSYATVGGERQDAVDHVLSAISNLSNQVADAADFLPAYDQRTYSDVVKELREQLKETMATFTPKARFQFKKRASDASATSAAKPDARKLNPVANIIASIGDDDSASLAKPADHKDIAGPLLKSSDDQPTARPIAVKRNDDDITIADRRRAHIKLPASVVVSRSTPAVGTLTNLERCVVDMSGATTTGAPFASLMLKDLTGSAIAAGHVDGPVHVSGVKDSVVMVAARQVRIHDCKDVVFYLHCVSRPIIEDSKSVRFAEAPKAYLTEKEKGERNLWDQVDDFNWLKRTPSPNWSLLPESDVIPDDVWKQALAGGVGVDIDVTLQSLRVGKGA
ncbi:hypothetical protein C8A03DRAFT_39886 [Achaetomium macrosporum]|uniref:C-CAP/cofactor C-like domain-containing protein n=1 Tax=Achaetomium macrosporum TaxID=79813 RepID=A0AAN7HF53_9PEZI|nr:hypothetical protein C8A03DRAFT_39886 [Achaetomium macrosporum]